MVGVRSLLIQALYRLFKTMVVPGEENCVLYSLIFFNPLVIQVSLCLVLSFVQYLLIIKKSMVHGTKS